MVPAPRTSTSTALTRRRARPADNVLIGVRPALRVSVEGKSEPQLQPTDAVVKENFAKIFGDCDKTGSPTQWEQLPPLWRADQERLLKLYDATAPYRGQKASLPPELHLWPKNEKDIKEGDWPQYNVGAFPFCFRLPDHATAEPKVNMGQAPGTHWYHAHVHGSTALNVANGLAGAFIIEGPYDDKLRDFYKGAPGGLEEKVLVIQQLETSLDLLSADALRPASLIREWPAPAGHHHAAGSGPDVAYREWSAAHLCAIPQLRPDTYTGHTMSNTDV